LNDRFAQPATVFLPVVGTAELAILHQPKGADFLAAKQTVHRKYLQYYLMNYTWKLVENDHQYS
jgi:hypothetical protein